MNNVQNLQQKFWTKTFFAKSATNKNALPAVIDYKIFKKTLSLYFHGHCVLCIVFWSGLYRETLHVELILWRGSKNQKKSSCALDIT
jgi:hypothetical protein